MVFPLYHLPSVAIGEVIRSLDLREIFLLPLISNKSKNFVRFSISKKSALSTCFTVTEDSLFVKLMKSNRYSGKFHEGTYLFKNEIVSMYNSDGYLMYEGTNLVEPSIRKILYYFVEAFKNTRISIELENGIREEFAMESIRFCRSISFPLRIKFRLSSASSESLQELLQRASENSDLILKSEVPKDFSYIPPLGGFKINTLHVENAHWLKIEDVVQCRDVRCYQNAPFLSSQEANILLKKVVNMEYKIECLYLCSKLYKDSDFSEMTEGLCDSPIEQEKDKQELKFWRKDGTKMMITLTSWCLHMKKVKRKAK